MSNTDKEVSASVKQGRRSSMILGLVLGIAMLLVGVWYDNDYYTQLGAKSTTIELVTEYPDSKPYIRAAADVLSAAATDGHMSAEAVEALLQDKLKDYANPAAVSAINVAVMHLVREAYKKYDKTDAYSRRLRSIATGLQEGAH